MIEKEVNKYVIATLDHPTAYLKSLHAGRYQFVYDIEGATKFVSRKTANQMVGYFRNDTGLYNSELLVVPVKVTFELIEED